MEKLLYTGKAKQMWSTDNPQILRVVYLNQATALNGKKKDKIEGKAVLNNAISTLIFQYLNQVGIPTHYLEQISPTEELVKKVEIIPLEMVTRNIAAGHFASRYGVKEGRAFDQPVEEMYYKSDKLDDPFMNASQAKALGLVTQEELDVMWNLSRQVNFILKRLFAKAKLTLVDFKLEFGRLADGQIVLADEFSPDNCRLWDMETANHMDKDVYRRDLGDLVSVYQEVYRRLQTVLEK
ncbi:phosphoribosylaminoimidazolesuccinocarboxamide synthase [Ligilactobacillus equi]|uniref:Phosphoribosylaminoimidazole-succinocarboxamide synthase n=1 Tax=Ligilactobacillus equi DSM 15833 = JCM 10991 TaxID=1423740 RepID=A0A0R1TCC6_9LACO|nr:phosphoribosylaminoimidazolesuccinocarboxamide synthase [Ligilactobacillus equi]KRL78784.1 phosphoribosylamidoimidazole-succinocarboxamide synthase [Ligilactobacillus equi DSM 15833 = JCM 10991]